MAKLVLEPAHPLEGTALPLGHHLVEMGQTPVEGLIAAGEDLGQLGDGIAEAQIEVMVAALEPSLVVEQAGQGVAGGER
ncbi:hypothetical protein D3C78_1160500 [compost metagenome]